MNPLKIWYPFKPYFISQAWNNPNPAYQAAGFSFKNHNGIDAVQASPGVPLSEWPVYCPVEGFTVKSVDFAPQGGGNELWLVSDTPLVIGDKTCYAYMPLCHAKKVLVKAGCKPKLGQLLMIADNTGFSTGAHTHMGLYRVNYDGKSITYLDQNDAAGSYNPADFFTHEYAIDQSTLATDFANNLLYYRYMLGLA